LEIPKGTHCATRSRSFPIVMECSVSFITLAWRKDVVRSVGLPYLPEEKYVIFVVKWQDQRGSTSALRKW
jgi:hypothetical protein